MALILNDNFVIPTGREQVVIPITEEEFFENLEESLKKYIGGAYQIHQRNVLVMKYLHKQYLGEQDIIQDKKRYDSSEINNIAVENHIFRIINFKVGFTYGNPLEYTITNEEKINTNDLTYLNAYFQDVDKASLDIEKAQDLYEYGIAYQRLIPKRIDVKDINVEAPFELVNMPVYNTFVVYSNDIPRRKLFAVVVSEIADDILNNIPQTTLQIFLPKRKIVLKLKNNEIIKDIPQPYNFIPIQEYCLNKDRIGIVELVLKQQNTINKINSMQLDGMEEIINSFIVFYNQKFDDPDFLTKFKELKAQRILALNTHDPNKPAKVDMISQKLENDPINLFYERTVKAMNDNVFVPQASGNVTSGGDTGQARLLGNGWESAQNQAQVDQSFLTKYEKELLKNILWICKKTKNCPVETINASDVAIKFNVNMSNNLLVKAEAMKLLNSIDFPEKAILTVCGITKDVDGIGEAWKEKKKIKEEQEVERELAKNNNQSTNNEIGNNE